MPLPRKPLPLQPRRLCRQSRRRRRRRLGGLDGLGQGHDGEAVRAEALELAPALPDEPQPQPVPGEVAIGEEK